MPYVAFAAGALFWLACIILVFWISRIEGRVEALEEKVDEKGGE